MIFLMIFGVGLFLLLITFAVGELFDLGDSAAGDSGDALGEPGSSPFSSRILFVFMTAFGGFGYIGQVADWPTWFTLTFALAGGIGVAGGTFFLIVAPMARQQGSTRVLESEFLHLPGQVTAEIPEGGGLGKVALIPPQSGARVTQAARSRHGTRIPFGTAVIVVAVGPGAVTVEPTEPVEHGPAEKPASRLWS